MNPRPPPRIPFFFCPGSGNLPLTPSPPVGGNKTSRPVPHFFFPPPPPPRTKTEKIQGRGRSGKKPFCHSLFGEKTPKICSKRFFPFHFCLKANVPPRAKIRPKHVCFFYVNQAFVFGAPEKFFSPPRTPRWGPSFGPVGPLFFFLTNPPFPFQNPRKDKGGPPKTPKKKIGRFCSPPWPPPFSFCPPVGGKKAKSFFFDNMSRVGPDAPPPPWSIAPRTFSEWGGRTAKQPRRCKIGKSKWGLVFFLGKLLTGTRGIVGLDGGVVTGFLCKNAGPPPFFWRRPPPPECKRENLPPRAPPGLVFFFSKTPNPNFLFVFLFFEGVFPKSRKGGAGPPKALK